jgi:hypothetical protein
MITYQRYELRLNHQFIELTSETPEQIALRIYKKIPTEIKALKVDVKCLQIGLTINFNVSAPESLSNANASRSLVVGDRSHPRTSPKSSHQNHVHSQGIKGILFLPRHLIS